MLCPSCRHEIAPDAKVIFDDEAGIITGSGRAAYLTPKQMEFMILLRAKFPETLLKGNAMDAIYMGSADEPETKILDTFVCKIRQRIAGIGIVIGTVRGQGFRLRYSEHVA